MHVQTISAFEHGAGSPTKKTLEKIQRTLENAGIAFTDDDGVRRKASEVKRYIGQERFGEFFDDVYDVARTHPHPDLCNASVNELAYEKWLGTYDAVHMDRMIKLKIPKIRVLLKEGDTYLPGAQYCDYRWVSSNHFTDASLYLYGDKAAFIEFSAQNVAVTVVENKLVTDSLRKMFNTIWDLSSPVAV